MTKLDLTFNPYKKEAILAVNGEVRPKVRTRICGANGAELSSWVDDFFRRAVDEFNDKLEVTFNGTQCDYDFMENVLKRYEDRDIIQLRQNRILPADPNLEIVVTGGMACGKATLIDSMIGRKLLSEGAMKAKPASSIVRIHKVTGMPDFKVMVYDVSGNVLKECETMTLDGICGLNDVSSSSVVEIYGDIPFIESNGITMTATFGSSNYMTSEHLIQTYSSFDGVLEPMIIYVLNAMAIGIVENDKLIRKVATIMKQGDGQNHDRLLFVLNKSDVFDPDTEPIARTLDYVRAYLGSCGISNPRVMPASARLAKLIRQSRNASSTIKAIEKRVLCTDVDWFVNENRIHFSDYATFLSPSTDIALKQRIQEGMEQSEKYKGVACKYEMALSELALLYSGVPSIEMAISEYYNLQLKEKKQ